MASNVTPLKIGDEGFLIASTIDRCPKVMMLRELVKNGLEACQRAHAGERRVVIDAVELRGVKKLSIWNTGPGMNADELYRMCDISSSIRKQQSLEQNFGIGAKVATLPSNTLGIRYRSCTGGRVHQVVLGKRDGIYGRLLQPCSETGEMAEILDVTDDALMDGRTLDQDWTEVLLHGQRSEQSTVTDPYDGNPTVEPGWIRSALEDRFFDLDDGVEILLTEAVQPDGRAARVLPTKHHLRGRSDWESVVTDSNVVVTYVFSEPTPGLPAAKASPSALEGGVSIVFKGEIYDLRREQRWLQMAPMFGIPFGAKYTTIFIELSEKFPALPDTYRQFLRYRSDGQWQVESQHFSPRVNQHRPAWLIERLAQLAPDGSHTQSVRGEMSSLLAELRILRRWWPPNSPPPPKDGPIGPPEYEVAPQIIGLRDPQEIAERGFGDKAGIFFKETHQIFLNFRYPAVERMSEVLRNEFGAEQDIEAVREKALIVAEQALARRVSRMVVFALGKREHWSQSEFDQAVSSASLTLAAEDYLGSLPQARQEMETHFSGFTRVAA